MRRPRYIIGVCALAVLAGCGLKAGVNEVGRDQNTTAGNVGSGNQTATSQAVSQPMTTTQQSTATSGKGPALAESATAAGGHSAQTGAVNIAWQPVAAGGGIGLASLITWLAWSSRNQKRELDARTASEKLDYEADRVLIDAMSQLASKAIDKRFP